MGTSLNQIDFLPIMPLFDNSKLDTSSERLSAEELANSLRSHNKTRKVSFRLVLEAGAPGC